MVSSASARPRGRQVNALQALALLLSFVLMAGLGGVLAAGLVMPAVATTSTLTDTSVRLFDDLPTELEEVPLSEKSTILAADGTLLATFYEQNRIVVPLAEISQDMIDAVVATEDRRFWEHGGIDPTGMARALVRNATSDEVEGASTLTQQYVKNALIQAALQGEDPAAVAAAVEAAREAEGAAGVARKLEEAKLAIALEQRLTKEEILERYLNIAQFGLSVYGVEAAAQHFFSVPAVDLNFLQAATIAGITQAPSRWDPERNPEGAQERRDVVLRLMRNQDFITEEEYQAGIATPIVDTLNLGETRLGCVAANTVGNAGYFCDYVTKVIRNDAAFGESPAERSALLYRGGLTITTTLDPARQVMADEEVKAGIPVDDPSGVASAISVVEPGTGRILAMAQNRIYNSAEGAGPGQTAVNYNTDSAYGSSKGFAPGSTFKPFTLVQWLKEGHSLNERIDARLRTYNMSEFEASCTRFAPGEYKFGNAEGDGGVMTVLDATRNSVNSGYIKMASEVDLCGIFDTASSMGIHRPDGSAFDPLPANVIGSQEVAPLTMASAFATFASGGTYCDPVAITSVIDTNGNELPVPQANCRQALTPEIANAMNFALSGVWDGTARSVGAMPGRPSAGKTGTTSQNEYTWFLGYTPQMATAVWVGFPDAMRPVQDMRINGRYYRNVFGSSIAAPTWKRFMVRAHEGLPVVQFADVDDRLVFGERSGVPQVAGQSVEQATSTLERRGFAVRVGTPRASDYPVGSIAASEPAAGTRVSPGTTVWIYPSTGPAATTTSSTAGDDGGNNGRGRGGGGGGGGGGND